MIIQINKFHETTKKLLQKMFNSVDLQQAKKNLKNLEKPYKLHVGCGQIKLAGWINLDIEKENGIADIAWNASQGFPFLENNSCSVIYNEHFLEHLAIEQATIFLSDCYRILKSGGVLRIAMPSLEYVVKKYHSEDWQNQDWLTWKEYRFIQTRAEMINIAFRWWGHQWLYDHEELYRRLREAGFEKIKNVEWGCSNILELRNLETRKDSILICEAEK
jgi:predicted SAM-dependent methyltransferase